MLKLVLKFRGRLFMQNPYDVLKTFLRVSKILPNTEIRERL